MSSEIVSCSINPEDRDFCQRNGIKISQLLRWAVNERRGQIDGSQTFSEEKRKREAFQKLAHDQREFIEKYGLLDKLVEEQTKHDQSL